MEINAGAPAVARGEIEVAASRRSMSKALQKAIDAGLRHLKIEARTAGPEHRRRVEAG
jgi:hypothetical protein